MVTVAGRVNRRKRAWTPPAFDDAFHLSPAHLSGALCVRIVRSRRRSVGQPETRLVSTCDDSTVESSENHLLLTLLLFLPLSLTPCRVLLGPARRVKSASFPGVVFPRRVDAPIGGAST